MIVKSYDNNGAHNAAKSIMSKSENVSIQFKTGKDDSIGQTVPS